MDSAFVAIHFISLKQWAWTNSRFTDWLSFHGLLYQRESCLKYQLSPNGNSCANVDLNFILKMCRFWPLFVYFRPFFITISLIQTEKSVDGVLGIQTRGPRMVGADITTELWRPPLTLILFQFYILSVFENNECCREREKKVYFYQIRKRWR